MVTHIIVLCETFMNLMYYVDDQRQRLREKHTFDLHGLVNETHRFRIV